MAMPASPSSTKSGASPWSSIFQHCSERRAGTAEPLHGVRGWSFAIAYHARALPQDDPRGRPVLNGGFIGRDGDLEIVVSWRLIKDSEHGGSGGRNRRARCLPRVKR